MPISIEADPTLAQGYIKVNGTTAATASASGITATITGNVTGNVTGNLTGSLTSGGSLTLATAQNTTSGTSIDFTGIPSWVKRITVMFNAVSTNGNSLIHIRAGTSGGVVSSGYLSSATNFDLNSLGTVTYTAGFSGGNQGGAASIVHGTLSLHNVSGNTWSGIGVFAQSDTTRTMFVAGSITLSATLDRVRITTVNGTDTFDAGSINIMYEG
jgi:hypothetical protein